MSKKPKSGLTKWHKEKWVNIGKKNKDGSYAPCGRKDADKGKYPKCVPASKAKKMTKKEKESAVRRKRVAETKSKGKKGRKPVRVKTKKGSKK